MVIIYSTRNWDNYGNQVIMISVVKMSNNRFMKLLTILYLFTYFYIMYCKGTDTFYKSVSFLWEALEMFG